MDLKTLILEAAEFTFSFLSLIFLYYNGKENSLSYHF